MAKVTGQKAVTSSHLTPEETHVLCTGTMYQNVESSVVSESKIQEQPMMEEKSGFGAIGRKTWLESWHISRMESGNRSEPLVYFTFHLPPASFVPEFSGIELPSSSFPNYGVSGDLMGSSSHLGSLSFYSTIRSTLLLTLVQTRQNWMGEYVLPPLSPTSTPVFLEHPPCLISQMLGQHTSVGWEQRL